MNYFASQVKNIRLQKGYTLQQLAEIANVSKSMISKIENNSVQPTLDIAARLAGALGKTLSEMLHTQQPSRAVLLKPREQAVWQDPRSHIKRRNISPIFEGSKIEWVQIELPGNAAIGNLPARAETEKYLLVTKGKLDIKISESDAVYHLNAGDSFYFEANHTHEFVNPGKSMTEYFLLIKHS